MKKLALPLICLFCCVAMYGCTTKPVTQPSASSAVGDTKFTYNSSLDSLTGELEKEMKKILF